MQKHAESSRSLWDKIIHSTNMCGIAYFHSLVGPANRAVRKRYEKQKNRGQEGFGFVALCLESRNVAYHHRTEGEKEILSALEALRKPEKNGDVMNAILFHHRRPTSTPNLKECAHPIQVSHESLEHTYFVVHNGMIGNAKELKEQHEKLGFVYRTELKKQELWSFASGQEYYTDLEPQFNDSEALAIEMARFIDGKSETMKAQGSQAVVVIQCTKDLKAVALWYGRNYLNPLHLDRTKDYFSLTSEGDHKDSVDVHKLYRYDYETKEITHQALTFAPNPTYRGGYEDYGRTTTTLLPLKQEIETKKEDKKEESTEIKGDIKDLPPRTPSMTLKEYKESVSMLDFNIDDLVSQGHPLREIEAMIENEITIVDSLIEWEDVLYREDDKEFLQNRREDLWQLGTDVSNEITLEEYDEDKALAEEAERESAIDREEIGRRIGF